MSSVFARPRTFIVYYCYYTKGLKLKLKVYLPITENIHTTVQHQMAGCQRGLSLSKLATHGYNNVITTHKRITRKKKIRATADAECSRKKVYTEQYQEKEVQHDIEGT